MHMLVGLWVELALEREIYIFFMAKLYWWKSAVNKCYTGCAEIKNNTFKLDSKGKMNIKKCIIL